MQNRLVAELFLPIPEPSHMSGRVELECFEFSSDQQVFYKHEGVGSGEFLLTKFKHTFLLQSLCSKRVCEFSQAQRCVVGCLA